METIFWLACFGAIFSGAKTLFILWNFFFYEQIYNNVEKAMIELNGGIIKCINWKYIWIFIACLIVCFTI